MSAWLKRLGRSAFHGMGYDVHRRPAHRFDAMAEGLALLRRAGCAPRLVIDGGANRGQWAGLAMALFPDADFALVEPQEACAPALAELARRRPGVVHHALALSAPGVERVRLLGAGRDGGGTGAFVARPGEADPEEVEAPAATLDSLFAARVTAADRALLKLDLEGHELEALAGGERLLGALEVVVSEVSFYELEGDGRPVFSDLLRHLEARGFDLYDICALAPRPRDLRLRQGDVIFVRRGSPLVADRSWR